jgi:hypothetical protein
MPAKAGIQRKPLWIPACAGMTTHPADNLCVHTLSVISEISGSPNDIIAADFAAGIPCCLHVKRRVFDL